MLLINDVKNKIVQVFAQLFLKQISYPSFEDINDNNRDLAIICNDQIYHTGGYTTNYKFNNLVRIG